MACFLDVKKCFDSINHKILLQKLVHYGFNPTSHKWFTNYLDERKQFVASNGKTSNCRNISTGVPQGSALGPLLFIIFINDLPQHIRFSSSNMFADDCCLYKTGKSFDITKALFQESVNDASFWYTNNNLPINISKSFSMLSASDANLNRLDEGSKTLDIIRHNEKLDQVSNTPYLGTQLDCKLKWDHHVLKLCKNVSYKLSLLNRLRNTFDKNVLNHLYLSIIQPSMDFAISVWGYCSDANKEMVTRLQHRAARIVTGNRDYINVRGADLVKEMGWQTIDQRRNYFTATLMYRCINGIAPQRLINELVMSCDTHDIPTRFSENNNVQVPQPNYEIFRRSFKYQSAILWNGLPSHLKNAPDIYAFKQLYKSQYFKGVAG